jgi:hypothetical protein
MRSGILNNVHYWRASDLLVWNSADATRKGQWITVTLKTLPT